MTECATLSDRMLVFSSLEKMQQSFAVSFDKDLDFKQFKELVNNIRSGKIQSMFEKRTEETSAVQYFQFYR